MMGWVGLDVGQLVRDNRELVARMLRWSWLPVAFCGLAVEGAAPAGDLGLRMKGLELLISGRPEEAEGYFRKALAQSTSGEARACAGLSGRCAGGPGAVRRVQDMPGGGA